MTVDGDNAFRRPEDHGHWDGTEFVFDKPISIGGNIIKRLQTEGMVLAEGVSRDDVIHALLNPSHGFDRVHPPAVEL